MPPLALLVPSSLDLAGWAGVIFATLAMTGLGRILTLGRAPPESALIAGWGACVLALTLLGVVLPIDLRIPAIVLAVIGLIGLIGVDARAPLRVVLLALPLLALLASARPSLPDTWLNLLPNAAYLHDHGFFPADARPPAHSLLAGAPYNMQLASYLAGLFLPNFPASAMIDFNLVLQLAAALLLARMIAGDDAALPRWSVIALGLLLAIPLNPGFDPRYHLSPYSEPSVMVVVAFAGWHAARALDRLAGGRDARSDLVILALALAALVNIKQESVALVCGIVVAALVLAMTARAARAEAVRGLVLAALPALVLYLAWRGYVLSHFALGELKGLPLAAWHIRELPEIFLNILRAIASKGVFFAILFVMLALAAWRLTRRELDLGTRLGALLLGTTLVYNLALFGAYVAHFEGEMGIGAHSYFRYSTHLGLLLMATIVMFLRDWHWSQFGSGWRRAMPAVVVLLALLLPLPFLPLLRFDLEVPNLRAYQAAHEAATRIADNARLLLILPGDNGSVAPTIEGLLRDLPPRRPNIELEVANNVSAGLGNEDYSLALLSCAPFPLVSPALPPRDGALLKRVGAGWEVEASWSYAPPSPHAHWSQVLAPAALCLP